MQEIETTQTFSADGIMQKAIEMSIEQNLDQLEETVKKHIMHSFRYVKSKFPMIQSFSWYQNKHGVCSRHYDIKVNGLDYFKIKQKQNQYNPEAWDYVQNGTNAKSISVAERYSLFKNQLEKDFKNAIQETEPLLLAAEVFSAQLNQISPDLMLLVLGKNVIITVSEDQFNYCFTSYFETCDG